jgi:hypothetical protein
MEADREGLRLSAAASYSAAGAAPVLDRWTQLPQEYVIHAETPTEERSQLAIDSLQGYFRSHSLPSERLAQANEVIANDHLPRISLSNRFAWNTKSQQASDRFPPVQFQDSPPSADVHVVPSAASIVISCADSNRMWAMEWALPRFSGSGTRRQLVPSSNERKTCDLSPPTQTWWPNTASTSIRALSFGRTGRHVPCPNARSGCPSWLMRQCGRATEAAEERARARLVVGFANALAEAGIGESSLCNSIDLGAKAVGASGPLPWDVAAPAAVEGEGAAGGAEATRDGDARRASYLCLIACKGCGGAGCTGLSSTRLVATTGFCVGVFNRCSTTAELTTRIAAAAASDATTTRHARRFSGARRNGFNSRGCSAPLRARPSTWRHTAQ